MLLFTGIIGSENIVFQVFSKMFEKFWYKNATKIFREKLIFPVGKILPKSTFLGSRGYCHWQTLLMVMTAPAMNWIRWVERNSYTEKSIPHYIRFFVGAAYHKSTNFKNSTCGCCFPDIYRFALLSRISTFEP